MRSLNFPHIMLLSYSKPVPSNPYLFLLGGAVAPPDPQGKTLINTNPVSMCGAHFNTIKPKLV